ncbi:MAG: hypothetical protein QW609_03150 [Candidatus Aenigmatarchaeota archaeon]
MTFASNINGNGLEIRGENLIDLEYELLQNSADLNLEGFCQVGCEVDFDAWLGIDNKINMTLGQTFPVSVYIRNRKSVKDSYSLSVTSSSNIRTKLLDSRISDILPNSVFSTKVEIKPIAISSAEEVKIKITSDSGAKKELTLEIKVKSSNMDDIDLFSIVFLISVCFFILVKKLYTFDCFKL